MTESQFAELLWPIVQEASGIEVPPDQDLDVKFGAIDLDSLTQVEIFSILEEKLDVRFGNDALFEIWTPRDLLDLINRTVPAE